MKPIAITIIVVGFLICLKFQFPHYSISSSHMHPTMQKGDVVLVNRFVKGNDFKNNDICVLNINDEKQISRVVGLPGDKIEIKDGMLFVNDIKEVSLLLQHTYRVRLRNHPPLAEYDLMLLLEPSNVYEEYTANLTEEQMIAMAEFEFVASIEKIIHPKGYLYAFLEHPIYPNTNSFNWSRDNFGPFIIPKKGDQLSSNGFVIENNYYFVLGDNRHQSLDSRYVGLIPEKDIVGKMIATLYSPNA